MGWFANRGQILQIVLQLIALIIAGRNAFPSFMANELLSLGALLFYALVASILVSLWFVFSRSAPGKWEIQQEEGTRARNRLWLILPGIALILIVLYPYVRLYTMTKGYIEPLTFEDLLQSYIHDRSLYVADLARTDLVVRDRVFENVRFVGPAVIVLRGSGVLTGSTFLGVESADSVLLEVPETTITVGAIIFEDSVFRNCQFERIQVMGPKAIIDKLRENFAREKK